MCSPLAEHSPTVRRQEGVLPPNHCQHELEITPVEAQISSCSPEEGEQKTQITSATNSGTVSSEQNFLLQNKSAVLHGFSLKCNPR